MGHDGKISVLSPVFDQLPKILQQFHSWRLQVCSKKSLSKSQSKKNGLPFTVKCQKPVPISKWDNFLQMIIMCDNNSSCIDCFEILDIFDFSQCCCGTHFECTAVLRVGVAASQTECYRLFLYRTMKKRNIEKSNHTTYYLLMFSCIWNDF